MVEISAPFSEVRAEGAQRILISVVVPAFEAETTLAEALESIRRQGLGSGLEIIVVDDGSRDGTAAVAAAPPDVRLIRQPNAGPSAARNRGIAAARGEMLAFLDADDWWAPGRLPRLVRMLQERPQLDMVQGLIQQQRQRQTADGETTLTPEFAPYQFISLSSGVYRRAVFDRVGPLDESLPDNEDTDWMLRAWELGVRKRVDQEVFLNYRVHDGSMTRGGSRNRASFARVLHGHLTRVRSRSSRMAASARDRSALHEFLGAPPPREPVPFDAPFTIISNDSWGGDAYRSLGWPYATPFVATRIFAPCFLTLLQDLDHFLAQPLTFVPRSRYGFMNARQVRDPYPLALLGGAVEIHFLHESDADQARRKWERRLARINRDRLFIKFSEDPGVCKQEHLEAFEALPHPYKVCFTRCPYPGLKSCLPIPAYFPDQAPIFPLSAQHFQVIRWLRREEGPDPARYRIHRAGAEASAAR